MFSGRIPTVQGCCSRFQIAYNHPWRQQTGYCICVWFPICPRCFLGGFRQSETGPVDYSQFPRWRQQTGSSYAVHNCKCETWFFDQFRLPQTCALWISQNAGVSDNCGSYEYCSRSYLGCLLTDFEKVDCLEINRWPSCVFQDGWRGPE